MNARKKVSRELVVACSDGSKVLEFIEEALDEIAFTIGREIGVLPKARKPTCRI